MNFRAFVLLLAGVLTALGGSASHSPKSSRIEANGIHQHYLDWGGEGTPIVFLAGFGLNAHEFDDLAPRLVSKHHVFALTRRGFGESDKPAGGYDLQTRAKDITAFLHGLKISPATLIGHSMAGDEMVRAALDEPQSIHNLVFLDAAAVERPSMAKVMFEDPMIPPMWKKLAADVIGTNVDVDVPKDQQLPAAEYARFLQIIKTSTTTANELAKVQAPALIYFAIPKTNPAINPEMPETDKKAAEDYFQTVTRPMMVGQMNQVRTSMPKAKFMQLDGDHYFFTRRGQETAQEILDFLK